MVEALGLLMLNMCSALPTHISWYLAKEENRSERLSGLLPPQPKGKGGN